MAPINRPAARASVRSWLDAGSRAVVRLNPCGTADHALDIGALCSRVDHVMLPKIESAMDAEATAAAGITHFCCCADRNGTRPARGRNHRRK